MLDSHRLNDQEIPELWYNGEFPEEKMLEAWDTVLGDTKHHWNREYFLVILLFGVWELMCVCMFGAWTVQIIHPFT